MLIDKYQEFAKENWRPGCHSNPVTVFALGLAGECGEVLEEIKKATRDVRPVNKERLSEELGDVLWYVANLCTTYGLSLREVIENNVNKLNSRYGGIEIMTKYKKIRKNTKIEKMADGYLINNRYKIYIDDGVIYDTVAAEDIPQYIFFVRDELLNKS